MKFRKDRPWEVCGKVIPEIKGYEEYGGIVCMRIAGHAGACEPTMRDAAIADGRCWGCHEPIGEPHGPGCTAKP